MVLLLPGDVRAPTSPGILRGTVAGTLDQPFRLRCAEYERRWGIGSGGLGFLKGKQLLPRFAPKNKTTLSAWYWCCLLYVVVVVILIVVVSCFLSIYFRIWPLFRCFGVKTSDLSYLTGDKITHTPKRISETNFSEN